MAKISILPKDDRTNGWSAILPKRPITPALKGTQHADWVVIGAGFAGLAAARRLGWQQVAPLGARAASASAASAE